MTKSLMEIPENRDVTAKFHLVAGSQWLEASDSGDNTNALVYCGFEFRLALERIGLELLMHIRSDEQLEQADYDAITKLGSIRSRIYKVIGHQRQIDRKVEFANIILEALGQPFRITSVQLGVMMRHWHACSDLCHMQLTREHTWGDKKVRQSVYAELNEVKAFIEGALAGLSWSKTEDPAWQEIEDRYVEGLVTKEDVLDRLREIGVYGIAKRPDGTKHIIPGLKPGG